MSYLLKEDLGSRKLNSLERPESGNSPMTTLTLSAGLKDGEMETGSLAQSVEQQDISHNITIDQSANVQSVDQPADQTVDKMDDHALLEATRTGDEAAFRELVRRYQNQITNYVYRMLNDYDMAVDLAQETFVRVYKSADRYQATYSFSTYIYRIAHNLAISELRKRKRHRLIPLPTFFSDKDSEEVEVELPDQKLVLAEDAMIDDERRKAVTKAIASLPEKYKAALILCDLEERSYEEISEVLGLPTGTVKSRINRARNLLKDKLKDFY